MSLALVLLSVAAGAQSSISVVIENGHRVYVNDDTAQRNADLPQDPAKPPLMYWSATAHGWRPVPPANSIIDRRARAAAADVARMVRARHPEWQVRAASAGSTPLQASRVKIPAPEFQVRPRHISADLDRVIRDAAARHNVDAGLVRALIQVESGFDPSAISNKGAMGLMQLMPGTAKSLQVTNPFDPAQNVDAGVRILKQLLANFNGDVAKTLAAYNAGVTAVQKHRGVPPYKETQAYVKRITSLYNRKNPFLISGSSADIMRTRDDAGHPMFTNVE